MFSSARDVLEREREEAMDDTDARADRAPPSTSSRAKGAMESLNRAPAVARRSGDDDDAAARAAAKRARIERAEVKRARARAAPKQASLMDAWSNAMAKRNGGARARGGDVDRNSGLSKDLIQRILTRVPTSAYADARLVCRSWRDAIDDGAFMPSVKLNRSLALGDCDERRAATRWLDEATGRVDEIGLGPLARYIATRLPFKSELDVETLCRFVDQDEHLSGATKIQHIPKPADIDADARYQQVDTFTDEARTTLALDEMRFWFDADTRASRSFLGTVGDISATIEEIAKFETVQVEVHGKKVTSGWAVLALAMAHVAENEFVGSRILRAARQALRQVDSDFVEEDLTEFIHLIVAYVRARLLEENFPPGDMDVRHELRRLKTRILAANDYANLHEEREWGGEMPGTSGMPDSLQTHTRLTHEQEAIVSTTLKPPQWMVVHAFAGSGKTTTLVEYARRHPSIRFLYLAFNRAITEEAKTKFPPNTDAKTFHGLAFGLATWYKAGGKKLHYGDKLRSSEVCKALGRNVDDPAVGRGLVTLNNYLISADDDINATHVPAHSTGSRDTYVEVARRLWALMKDRSSNDVPMTHAGYMKLYQLQRPRLDIDMSKNKNKTGYDVILLDEAQDISPVMFDIVLRQDKCAKIVVGDAHQQIYNFTGAMNVMNSIDKFVSSQLVTHRRLARSFRFGLEIANVANAVLNVKQEDALLIGARPSSLDQKSVFVTRGVACSRMRQLYDDNLPPTLPVFLIGPLTAQREQVTILVRSNASLVDALLKLLTAKDLWKDGKDGKSYENARKTRIHIIGGAEALKLDQILDFVRLIEGHELSSIKDRYIKSFVRYGGGNAHLTSTNPTQWKEREDNALSRIVAIAENQDDFETLNRINIAQSFGSDLYTLVDRLKSADVGTNAQLADFILTTAHKSKGLEFDNVMIWNDFENVHDVRAIRSKVGNHYVKIRDDPFEGTVKIDVPVDEINLAYVAVTRARRRVFLNANLAKLLLAPRTAQVDQGKYAGVYVKGYHPLASWGYFFNECHGLSDVHDHGFYSPVLRRVDLPSGESPNRLCWYPMLDCAVMYSDMLELSGREVETFRGDVCQTCMRHMDAANAFVFQTERESGLVCVSDRGVEARHVGGLHAGIFESRDRDAFEAHMRDVGHVRLDIDYAKDRRWVDDVREPSKAPNAAVYCLENPAHLFKTRVCNDCFFTEGAGFSPSRHVSVFGTRREKLRPMQDTLKYERELRRARERRARPSA